MIKTKSTCGKCLLITLSAFLIISDGSFPVKAEPRFSLNPEFCIGSGDFVWVLDVEGNEHLTCINNTVSTGITAGFFNRDCPEGWTVLQRRSAIFHNDSRIQKSGMLSFGNMPLWFLEKTNICRKI